MSRGLTVCVLFTVFSLYLAEMSCPVSWWYCLNRDPNDSGQTIVADTSNRSVTWSWDSGAGRWDVGYQQSFPTRRMAVAACYTSYRDGRPCCVSYDNERSWRSDKRPIPSTVWDIAYNGDNFGFQPGANGQYVFHIYSRNIHYNPWAMNGGSGGTGVGDHGVPEDPLKNCKDNGEQTTEGNGWWLKRKPLICPVVVSSEQLVSPMEWGWLTAAGRWKVVYKWGGGGGVNCTVVYTPSRAEASRLLSWRFDGDRLILDYSATAIRVYKEQPWKLMVSGGEAWGFTPATEGSWVFSVYSRNVIIRPFERSSGTFNLQRE